MSSLHHDAVVVDTHNDLLMLVARRPLAQQAEYFRTNWLPQLRAGGVDVQVLPVYIDDEYRPEGALRHTLRMLEAGHRIAEGNPDDVAICRTSADIDAALDAGKIALILALEGCEAVGTDVGLFETLFRLGVRMASFTHFGRTALADGSGEDGTGGRLTRAGRDALVAVEELGIVMDISHLSASGVDDILERATRPVVASHSSAFALRQHHRNLTDERLKGLAASGGVIGINFFAGFLDAENPSLSSLVDHIGHVASTAGIEHVGLGPDFIKEVFDELIPLDDPVIEGVRAKQYIPGLEGPTGLPLVTQALVERGVAEADVRAVLGNNWLRVLRAEMGVPASARGSR